jgi:quinol monooxygenase YgiN
MIIEYIRYKIPEEKKKSFLDAYTDASKELDASVHCLSYELSECEEESGQFMLRIDWTSTDDHLNGFRKSELFPPFLQKIRPFFHNIQEMRHYRLTALAKTKTAVL